MVVLPKAVVVGRLVVETVYGVSVNMLVRTGVTENATVTEAVDNAAVGTDLPVAPGADYDPAAVDAAQAQAAAANAPLILGGASAAQEQGTALTATGGAVVAAGAVAKKLESKAAGGAALASTAKPKKARGGENALWSDSTVMDVSVPVGSDDSGLSAVTVP